MPRSRKASRSAKRKSPMAARRTKKSVTSKLQTRKKPKVARKSRSKGQYRLKKRQQSALSHQKKKSLLKTIQEALLGPEQIISKERLFDFLSEFLIVEKGGIKLYTKAIENITDSDIQNTFQDFLIQTQKHAQLLTDAIVDLGGDPDYMSAGAIAQEILTQSMLELEIPPTLQELKCAENILLAETKDHLDWEFLKQIQSKVESDQAKAILSRIVDAVEDEEDRHVEFAKEAVSKLALKLATSDVIEISKEFNKAA